MNCISWNCRGVAAKGFMALVKDIRKKYNASLLFLLETHSSGDIAQRQGKRTGYSGVFIVDSRGQVGGIWCLWDTSLWSVEVINSSEQFVHLKVSWKNQNFWFTTVVYASPRYMRRQTLWEDLKVMADDMVEPWMILGDFNAIQNNQERRGVPRISTCEV